MEYSEGFATSATSDTVRPLVSPLTSQIAFAGGDFPAATQNIRRLAEEIAGLSANSLERTRSLIEHMRDAQQMDELVAIQSKFVTAMFQSFTEGSRRISSLLADWPRDVTQAGCDMFEAGVEAAQNVADVTATALAAANVASEMTPPDIK